MNVVEPFLLLWVQVDGLFSVCDFNVSHKLLLLMHHSVQLKKLLDLVVIFFLDYLLNLTHSERFSGQFARQDRCLEVLGFEFVD